MYFYNGSAVCATNNSTHFHCIGVKTENLEMWMVKYKTIADNTKVSEKIRKSFWTELTELTDRWTELTDLQAYFIMFLSIQSSLKLFSLLSLRSLWISLPAENPWGSLGDCKWANYRSEEYFSWLWEFKELERKTTYSGYGNTLRDKRYRWRRGQQPREAERSKEEKAGETAIMWAGRRGEGRSVK